MDDNDELGFVITPGEIQNRIQALDAAIQALNTQIQHSNAPLLNEKWRNAWGAFRARWAIERDSYATWDSRLFATRVMPRVEAFEESYRKWSSQFTARTKEQVKPPSPRPPENFLPEMSNVWLFAGVALALMVWSKSR
jgi:hypothetical protein